MLPLCLGRHGGQRQIRHACARRGAASFRLVQKPHIPFGSPVQGVSCTRRKASRGVFPEGKHPEPSVTEGLFFHLATIPPVLCTTSLCTREAQIDCEKCAVCLPPHPSLPKGKPKTQETARFRAVFYLTKQFSGSGRVRRRYSRMPSGSYPHRRCADRCPLSRRQYD